MESEPPKKVDYETIENCNPEEAESEETGGLGIFNLLGYNVHDVNGAKIDLRSKCKEKLVGLFFSAQWCSPCRQFTPCLVEFYLNHHKEQDFEIVFI